MYSYNDVIAKIDRELRKEARRNGYSCRKRNNRVHRSPKMIIKQSDVLLVNFGDAPRGISGKRPAVVISNNESIWKDNVLMVVPLFRNPSRDNRGDVEIRQIDCCGLRYKEHASIANVRKVYRRQVIRKIGHIKNENVIGELTASFLEKVGES